MPAVAAEKGADKQQAQLDELLDWLESLPRKLTFPQFKALVETYKKFYKGATAWQVAELGKEDLFFLLVFLLRRWDACHPWIYERCREVEEEPDGCLDLWARFHYKSTIITFALTIQDILRDPEDTFGIFSNVRPAAKAFLRQIKQEFEGNEPLKDLYPDVLWRDPKKEAPKWSEDDGIVVKRKGNPKEATVEAWGLIEGLPTGKHFKKRVYDDTVTEGSVTSPEMMEKTTRQVELSYALGTEDGVERWIGTRYHFNDSYRTIIDRGTVKVRLYDGTVDNCGDIKRPCLWSAVFMAQMRKKMGIYTFACQIKQDPKADATHGFKREWLERWTPDDGAGLNIYLLRDAANSKKQYADFTVDWVLGLGPDDNFYVLAYYRDRLNLTERTERLFELHRRWKPIEIRYEEYGMQGDIAHIQSEMKLRKYRFKIIKVAGRMPKPERIKRLIPLFEAHRVILPSSFHVTTVDHETKDMIHEFVENEYMAFPVPVNDDGLDGLSRICDTDGHVAHADGREEKVKLKLKWPAKLPAKLVVPSFPIKDRAMGY